MKWRLSWEILTVCHVLSAGLGSQINASELHSAFPQVLPEIPQVLPKVSQTPKPDKTSGRSVSLSLPKTVKKGPKSGEIDTFRVILSRLSRFWPFSVVKTLSVTGFSTFWPPFAYLHQTQVRDSLRSVRYTNAKQRENNKNCRLAKYTKPSRGSLSTINCDFRAKIDIFRHKTPIHYQHVLLQLTINYQLCKKL